MKADPQHCLQQRIPVRGLYIGPEKIIYRIPVPLSKMIFFPPLATRRFLTPVVPYLPYFLPILYLFYPFISYFFFFFSFFPFFLFSPFFRFVFHFPFLSLPLFIFFPLNDTDWYFPRVGGIFSSIWSSGEKSSSYLRQPPLIASVGTVLSFCSKEQYKSRDAKGRRNSRIVQQDDDNHNQLGSRELRCGALPPEQEFSC
jgi:hypothetical protein